MYLDTVFKQLTAGEFSQLALGTDDGLCESDRPDVIRHIQLGLTNLYKRFNLLKKQVDVTLVAGVNNYPLTSTNLLPLGGTASATQFLTSLQGETFEDRMFKITDVVDNEGDPVILNVPANECSVYTPSLEKLYVPDYLTTTDYKDPVITNLVLTYMCNHPLIDEDTGTYMPDTVNLLLPESHLHALLLFVASRVHNPIGMTNEFHAGNSYAAKYEQECQRLEGQNLEVDDTQIDNHFSSQGFI